MKKLTSHKQMNKIAKRAFALVLAGTFMFSSSIAFAEESSPNTKA